MIALMHSELSEMLEGVRKPKTDEHCPQFTSEEVELADVCIRIFDYAGGFQLRLESAINAKMEFNRGRPHKHGKAF
jgi:NTP pyrophosphatase (non-canonical NTP hydrolase)